MGKAIKIRFLKDSTYQVVEFTLSDEDGAIYEDETTLFQGSLPDCEAFIRLSEGGYM